MTDTTALIERNAVVAENTTLESTTTLALGVTPPEDVGDAASTVRDAATEAQLADIEAKFDTTNMSYFDKTKLALKYRDLYMSLFPHLEEKRAWPARCRVGDGASAAGAR